MNTTITNIRACGLKNTVIRQICDRHANVIIYLAERHDGTPQGMLEAAKRVSRRMFDTFDDASNIESMIIATDADGKARWSISQNFRIVTELETGAESRKRYPPPAFTRSTP